MAQGGLSLWLLKAGVPQEWDVLPAAPCSPLGQHRTPGPWSSASVLWTHRGDRPGWAQSLPASAFPSPSPGTSGLHGLHPRCWVPGPMGHRSGSGLLFFRERRPESEAAWHSGTAAHWAQGGSTRDSHCPAGAVFLTGMERSGPPRPLVALVLLWGRSCLRGRSGTAWTPRSWPQGQTQAPSEVDGWGSGDTALTTSQLTATLQQQGLGARSRNWFSEGCQGPPAASRPAGPAPRHQR